jgi:outer membrane immunogenic protein
MNYSKLIFSAVFAVFGFVSVASAADLPTKAPVAVAAPYSWSGFYLGANLGGSWGHSSTDVTLSRLTETPIGSTSTGVNGALGGLQVGYNWQTGRMVFGLETDIQATGQRGGSQVMDTVLLDLLCLAPCTPPPPVPVTGTFSQTQKLPWFGTFRGRIGVTPTDRWLLYVTGGLAYGETESNAMFSVPPTLCIGPCPGGFTTSTAASSSQTKAGWVLGGGIEAALGSNWTGKIEYLHLDFGNSSYTFASTLGPPFLGTFTASSRFTDDIVRLGLNYSFH